MAETVAELEAQLAQVNRAISSILTTGQSYSRPGFGKQSASLSDLQSLKRDLEKRIRLLNGDSAVSVMDLGGAASTGDEW